ncbi:MAG: topoisomerase C-terminal repeat-containing protein, partial [Stellaceae bacterium]
YQEDRDDSAEEEREGGRLPAMREREALARGEVAPSQHFTQPPPRYTEASLVKKLEELGIGRPSTYASILQVLQDRAYVRLDKRRFLPEDRGRLVTAFLTGFFERYVEYNFTADLENQLDDVSGGRIDWKELLRNFWRDFSVAVDGTRELTITKVLTALDEDLGRHFFPADESGRDPRLCPVCGTGRLSLKLGKFGAFIGCANYPNCRYTRPLAIEGAAEDAAADSALGTDAASGLAVTIKKGPFGHYVQLGEANGEGKPKRVALPRALKPAEVDLDTALRLLALPRELGRHPETGETIVAGIGRFGPYIKHGKAFKSLAADDDVLTIGLNRAVVLLAEPAAERRRGAPQPLRTLGPHPDGGAVGFYQGRYGPYVSHEGIIASLPKGVDADAFSLEEAVLLLAERRAKSPSRARSGARPAAAKPLARKAATPKRAAAAAKALARTAAKPTPAAKRAAAPAKKAAARPPAKKPRSRAQPA